MAARTACPAVRLLQELVLSSLLRIRFLGKHDKKSLCNSLADGRAVRAAMERIAVMCSTRVDASFITLDTLLMTLVVEHR
jgi:hypothetical protein